ncbi:hypothetical protein [Streptomyces sp. NBC_01565]|uniref:hypothetical protein n=1 Tax=unclassified Streptomyces TaxID=2593676 RepID=UPI00225AFFB8|nr:hypothetical protein [Streptomyces sp. NBC_01565]MCX4546568.1 hypothetical protein [Streptomyces sp. NBC_01565]
MELRQRVAAWFGRGDAQRAQAELDRLDRTQAMLGAAETDELQRVRDRQEASWGTRFEAHMESLDQREREQSASQLRTLLAEYTPAADGAATEPGGLTVRGNVDIRADHGSVSAGVIHGGAHIVPPPGPDPSQG